MIRRLADPDRARRPSSRGRWAGRLAFGAAAVASAAVLGLAATVALVYGVGIAVFALRAAERRRTRSGISTLTIGPDGRLTPASPAAGTSFPRRTL